MLLTFNLSAQNTLLKQANNGKISYSYQKSPTTNNFELHVVYKNETVIYKEQLDSIVINNKQDFSELTTALEKTIESISDSKATAYFEKPTYTLFKFDKGMLGTFISISNPSGSIIANNSKEQALTFLNWLKTIEFGKE